MIHLDPRSGSGELLPLFLAHRSCPAATLSPLLAGDFCFTISGPSGPTLLGIERKTISDMISSIRSSRLSGEQIPKLLAHYSPHVYLLLEGVYRVNKDTGYLQWPRTINGRRTWVDILHGKHPFLAKEMDNALSTITEKTPIKLWRTQDPYETVEWVLNKAGWGEKNWEDHHAHIGIHVPAPYVQVGKASDVRKTAFSLEGIGWERSLQVEQRFKTIEQMVNADIEEWMKIPGFGKVLSTKIWKLLRGKRDQ